MFGFFRQVVESAIFALNVLKGNLLRTTLSLLGVAIGIFAIISVFTFVDSMEKSIKKDLSFLGNNVLYIEKWAWTFDGPYQWWKYFQRPNTTYEEMKFLEARSQKAKAICANDSRGGITVSQKNNSASISLTGVTEHYPNMFDVELTTGRMFGGQDHDGAKLVCLIGSKVAETLYPGVDATNNELKMAGLRWTIIGVMKEEGKSLINEGNDPDLKMLIPYSTYNKIYNTEKPDISIVAQAYESDKNSEMLVSELTSLMRTKRGLRPNQDDNFSINKPEAITGALEGIFTVLTLAGVIIGGFSILVGGFGIANIMFVSVKERTNIIGIQKALGAKNYFILFQFVFEAIFLCLVGGLVGIILVWLLVHVVPIDSFTLELSMNNVVLGLVISTVLGVTFGIIPAYWASKLNPIEAIRND
jgi:putative ABC transport system permease protein